MPELPEVEFARSVIERAALNRPTAEVDDTDAYVCRPHRPGDIRTALLGRRLTSAHRGPPARQDHVVRRSAPSARTRPPSPARPSPGP